MLNMLRHLEDRKTEKFGQIVHGDNQFYRDLSQIMRSVTVRGQLNSPINGGGGGCSQHPLINLLSK